MQNAEFGILIRDRNFPDEAGIHLSCDSEKLDSGVVCPTVMDADCASCIWRQPKVFTIVRKKLKIEQRTRRVSTKVKKMLHGSGRTHEEARRERSCAMKLFDVFQEKKGMRNRESGVRTRSHSRSPIQNTVTYRRPSTGNVC